MASGSDDGSVHVFHATVYSDLLRNPLIVPLKILRAHEVGKQSICGKVLLEMIPMDSVNGRLSLFLVYRVF